MPVKWKELVVSVRYTVLRVFSGWAAGRLILRILDRRPRESVRCRKCWHDLGAQNRIGVRNVEPI